LGIGNEVFFTSYSGLYKTGSECSLVQVSNDFYTTGLLEDQEGLLWVSTLNNGVFCMQIRKVFFRGQPLN